MKYKLRKYQLDAVDAAVKLLSDREAGFNGIVVVATGGGKSLIVSEIAHRLNANVLVFCPTKEILEQNYSKMCSYEIECGQYSASVGKRDIKQVTFCTIGSVRNHPELFSEFDYILVDEVQRVNPEEGMYKDFFKKICRPMVGLTATPYRLVTEKEYDYRSKRIVSSRSQLRMLTNYDNPIFGKIIYSVNTKSLLEQGYLAKLNYYDVRPPRFSDIKMYKNSTGSDYSDKSIQYLFERTNFQQHLVSVINRLLFPKNGVPRNGILVFTKFVAEAEFLSENVHGCKYVSGATPKKEREQILKDFASKKIKVLANAGCLIEGYDRPDLDTVVLAAPTMSLGRYYQEVGRCIRPYKGKVGWIVDLVGNYYRFGDVADLYLDFGDDNELNVYSNGKQMTGYWL